MNYPLEQRKQMIEKNNKNFNIVEQCELLGISRSSYYYKSKDYTDFELLIMHLIDRIHTAIPTYGSRKLTVEINRILDTKGFEPINRKRIQNYMKLLGIETIYQKPNLSKLGKAEYIYPYLLKNLKITKANQVWSSDITYLPFENGFMYMYAIIDWYSRAILSFDVSNTLDNSFVISTIEDALNKYPTPEIMNSDQGSHFTSKEYTKLLQGNNIAISMDGKGRALDNVFIERFWRTLKYDFIFLYDFLDPRSLIRGITNFIDFYNNLRPHQALQNAVPMKIYNEKIYYKNINTKELIDFEYREFNYIADIAKLINKYAA